jgi:hypothetical protein
MVRRTASRLLCLAFTLTTLLLLTCQPGLAQKKPVPSGPNNAYLNMRKMTPAERRAAATRNAQRKAAAGQKNQVGRNAHRGVTK